MCLIIFSPNISKSKISSKVLERAFRGNPDGAGISYIEDGEVVIKKAYFTYEKFFKAYTRIVNHIQKGPLLIHFRLATCGLKSYTNTHPIPVQRHKLVMAHNGIINYLSEVDSNISDSVRLANLVNKLKWTLPFTPAQENVLECICEYGNKLVFLDSKGNYKIINEFLGTWKNGAWYSNNFSFTEEKTFQRQLARASRNRNVDPYEEMFNPPEDEYIESEQRYVEFMKYEMELERERQEKLKNSIDTENSSQHPETRVRACATFMPKAIVQMH